MHPTGPTLTPLDRAHPEGDKRDMKGVATRHPNVLLIISDQQRYDALGCNGQTRISTPNIDRLAESGTVFDNAFCTTPICTPSRTSILSGLFPHAHGSVANHQCRPGADLMRLSSNVKLVADYLKPEGYTCGYAGKWHLGTGYDRRGFSDFTAAHFIFDVDTPEQNEIVKHAAKLGIEITDPHQGGIEPDPEKYVKELSYGPSLLGLADHPASLMCDRAIDFISQAGRREVPFVLVWSTHEPHPPFTCPEPFFSMYRPGDMILPSSRRDTWSVDYLRGRRRGGHLPEVTDWKDENLQLIWAGYFGSVSFVDYLVGRLVSALHQTDMFDDTLIIYTSDHGDLMGSHGFNRKGALMFDELMKIPLIIRPPGGRKIPDRCERLVSQVDLVPTILEQCGGAAAEDLHGHSMKSLIDGCTTPLREGVMGEFHSACWAEDPPIPLRMWRTEKAKYVESLQGDDEFYDLEEDPEERANLICDPGSQIRIGKMKSALYRRLSSTGDTWPDVVQPPPGFLKKREI